MKTTKTQPKRELSEIARLLRVAGEPSRIEILCVIFQGQKICVSDIASELHMSVAIVSHHLQVMAEEGLLKPYREGKCAFYAFTDEGFAGDLKVLICKYKNN
ncbi:MAG: metalloregulator ArsR/SmtB family transcription factor [Candidatus Paceibacterota bacterium]|jgi:DNA-binding transcriptional ArsR family regulator